MLEEAGIVSVNEEGIVGLAENRIEPSRPGVRSVRRWRLSEELVRSRYKEKSRAFRNGPLGGCGSLEVGCIEFGSLEEGS